ncbi:hypothetical protein GIB67_024055 [Kingdonia uniflora]|uniref:Myb/SANT-like domain-containing protein n=1 Tax=Kingdonia uniflora TaxID=39325 RepID=A0A7J7LB39_9MAGN|nr:hypothetical protein GIB67_024055 [Kingdonia uniflora]
MAPTSGRVYLRWDKKMDTIFINTLLEQMQHGQKTMSGWSLMVYNKAYFNLKREANLDVTVEQCKTRWKTLKANHLLVKKVVKSSGFRWNEETQLVTVEEMVWKEFIEVLKSIMKKPSLFIPLLTRTPNRVSSSTTPGASAPSTGASAPKKNKVRRDSLDREGAIEKLALAADKLAGNVGRPDLAVLEKELKEIPTLSKDGLIKALLYYRDNDGAAQGFLAVSHE